MTTVDCRCCTPELKTICKLIGWIGIVVDSIFTVVFLYCLHQSIGSKAMTRSFLIVAGFHLIGSICLLIAMNMRTKLVFLPWVISTWVAIILLAVGAFIWNMYYNTLIMLVLAWGQVYVWKYIAETILKDRGIIQQNV